MERQFFPELSSAEPRFATGLDLLEKDHEVLDDILDRFTRASNRYLKLLDLDPTSAEQELGDIHTAGCHIQSLLSRHLQDEEDMIVPIILHGKLRG
jgi:iron-sulfur cluster repair protein YtfE (RIC family)